MGNPPRHRPRLRQNRPRPKTTRPSVKEHLSILRHIKYIIHHDHHAITFITKPMPHITATETIALAYVTELDPTMIKSEVIQTAELKYVKPVLTAALYDDVVANPDDYAILITSYIKPCLAFFVKYAMLNQQLLETAQYTPGADPSLSPALVEISTAVLLPRDHRRDTMQEVLSIARSKQTLLQEYVITQNYPLYTAPASKRVSGFRIVSTNS